MRRTSRGQVWAAFGSRARLRLIVALGGALLSAVPGPVAAAGDPAAGRSAFLAHCGVCHTVLPGRNRIGPTLFGVFGHKSASVPGYAYSHAYRDADLTWDEATLTKYLESPQSVIPGTKMTFGGLKDPARRADLIAYLATLK